MITNDTCLNCICVPSCKYKSESVILRDCSIIKSHIKIIFNDVSDFTVIDIHFVGLDRIFMIERLSLKDLDYIIFIREPGNANYKGIVI